MASTAITTRSTRRRDTHTLDIEATPVLIAIKSGPADAAVGSTATYTVTLSHGPTSDGSPVGLLIVIDDIAGSAKYISGDTNGDTLIDAGETWNYSVSYAVDPSDPNTLTNIVTANGVDADGDLVTTSDSHDTNVEFAPVISIVKSGPSAAAYGDTVTYTFDVRHGTGSDLSPISGVTVSDDVAGGATYVSGDDGDTLLEAGEVWTFAVDYDVTGDQIDVIANIGTASGTDGDGDTISSNDNHNTSISFSPLLTVDKVGPTDALVGETVTYQFAVAHDVASDGSPVSNITISDSVAGSPVYLSGDLDVDGRLDNGETWLYEVSYTIAADDPDPLTNIASVSGTDGDGTTLATIIDSHETDIDFQPEVAVNKTGPTDAVIGDVVTYVFEVAHTLASDGSAVSSIVVSDDVAGSATYVSGDDGDGALEGGETWRYEVQYTVVATDPASLVNTVTVTSTDRDGEALTPVQDNHTTAVDLQPVLEVSKSGPATVAVGDDVTYTFDVSHAASSDLSPATVDSVTDDLAGAATYVSGDIDLDGLLDSNEIWRYEATRTVLAGDPDPLDNTVEVAATDGNGEAVPTATDSHSTNIDFAPVIEVVKSGPASATVGQTVTYTFAVSHDATSDGSAVTVGTVVDDVAGAASFVDGDDNSNNLLDASETWNYAVSYAITATEPNLLENTVTVTSTDRDGDALVDATGTHQTNIEFAPELTVAKTGPATALVGETVTYEFEVSHDATSDGSDVTLISVTDSVAGAATYVSGDTGDDGVLAAGEVWLFDVDYTVQLSDADPLINIATASGTDLDGDAIPGAQDSHSTDIDFAPVLNIVKSGVSQAGDDDTVTFTFTVNHDATSDGSPVTSVTVTDDIAGAASYVSGDTGDDGILDSGETWTFTADYTIQATDPDPLINVGTVSGTDADAEPVTGSDSHSTDIIRSALVIDKTGPSTAIIGQTVTYEFSVSHAPTSDGSPFSNVSISDSVAGAATYLSGDLNTNDLLDIDETWLFDVDYTVQLSDADPLINIATVNATDIGGGSVIDTDSHSTDIDFAPVLNIVKSGASQAGDDDTVTFTFTVNHDATSDGSPVTSVTVTDDIAGAASYVSGDTGDDGILDSGETWTFTADYTIQATDPDPLINVGTVSGTDADAEPVTGSDSHSTDIIRSGIEILKTTSTPFLLSGETASFTIEVSNTGDDDLTNVIISDPKVVNCDRTIALLAVGETVTYSCELTNTLSTTVNVVNVTATDSLGATLNDSATATATLLDPAIAVDITPDSQSVIEGDTASFTIVVTNTGDSSLTDVNVAAPAELDCVATIGTLAAGESFTYTCEIADVTADLTNSITASGTDLSGGIVSATDSANVTVLVPAIDIEKTPAVQQIVGGDAVTFTISVTNAGATALSSIIVSDPLTPTCDRTFASLAIGETITYDCTTDPVVADFTNVATVTGTDPLGITHSDVDQALVDAILPAVAISKTPDVQAVTIDGPVTFTIEVTNTGDVPLTNVAVTDALAPDCDRTFASLDPGTNTTYSCTLDPVAADFTNTAVVEAMDPLGNTLTDQDTADVTALVPGIAIDKTPDTQDVLLGGTASFTLTVTNTGETNLTDVTVTDPLSPDCDRVIGDLAVGESVTFACSKTDVTAGFTNTATVDALDPIGAGVTASDTADVSQNVPAITLVKDPSFQTIAAGDTVGFTLTVTNTSAVTFTSVVVSDPAAPNCDTNVGTLAAGESVEITCSLASVTDAFTNTATVSADDPFGGKHVDSDDAVVAVVNPELSLIKTTSTPIVHEGDTITFEISVANDGDVPLTDVTVTDPVSPDCDAFFASLAVGENQTYNCTMIAPSDDVVNVATVTGFDTLSVARIAAGSAEADIIAPAVTLTVTPNTQSVVEGGDATIDITVTNSGDATLDDLSLTLPPEVACSTSTLDPLAPGEAVTLTCTTADVTADLSSTISVTGTDVIDLVVTDDDLFDIAVLIPGVEIQKSPDLQFVIVDETAEFTITVVNTGETVLTDVAVTDALVPACDNTIGDLEIGEAVSYMCSFDATGALGDDFTNVALVSATDPIGSVHESTDDAAVDVIAPALEVTKSPDTQAVVIGGTANFIIEVANTGDVDLTNVLVTDAAAPNCDRAFALIEAGSAVSYSCSQDNGGGGINSAFTNTVEVLADEPSGGTLADSATADVVVLTPSVSLRKTAVDTTILQGDVANFEITVTNTGQTVLTNVAVSDPLVPSCDNVVASLAVGVSSTWTCASNVLSDDLTNIAGVDATDPLGNTWSDSDDVTVTVSEAGSLSGTLFYDTDNDGVFDLGEPPLANIDVTVTAADGNVYTVTSNAAGEWTVPIVAAGDATIEVDLSDPDYPAGYGVSTGGDAPTGNATQTAAVTSLTNTASDPVGIATLPAISGTAWNDLNADTIEDGSESTLAGVIVELLDADGNVVATAITGADGLYSIENLTPGDYTVTFAAPDGSSMDSSTPTVVPVTVGYSDTATVDSGWYDPASVTGVVWSDSDGDGVRAGDELGIEGTTISLVDPGPDGVIGTSDDITIDSTTTLADGTYRFDGITPGDYVVIVDEDPDYITAGSDQHPVSLTSGDSLGILETGTAAPAAVSGTLWVDFSGDGIFDASEPAVAGVTLEITHTASPGSPFTVVTDADGNYSLSELVPGEYTIAVVAGLPESLVGSFESDGILDGFATITIPAGAEGEHNIGYVGDNTLAQTLWLDFDGDDTLDDDELRFDGVSVDVVWAGFDGVFGTEDDWFTTVVSGDCTTDSGVLAASLQPGAAGSTPDGSSCPAGLVTLDDLPDGDYRLDVVDDTGLVEFVLSVDPVGATDGAVATTLGSDDGHSNIDLGYVGNSALGDLVFIDNDGDGLHDSNEQVLSAVTVMITWFGPDNIVGTADDQMTAAETGTDGRYLVEGLPSGLYQVRLADDDVPSGYDNLTVNVTLGANVTQLDGDIPLEGTLPPPSGPLAFTGSTIGRIVTLGMMLLLIGLFLLFVSRRRPQIV